MSHFHLHFIKFQSFDMFRALYSYAHWSRVVRTLRDQPTSTTANNNYQTCVRAVSPEDGQVMPETCRDFEP
jgi:hypothetical protein